MADHRFTVRLPDTIVKVLDEFREKHMPGISRNQMIVMLFEKIAKQLKGEK